MKKLTWALPFILGFAVAVAEKVANLHFAMVLLLLGVSLVIVLVLETWQSLGPDMVEGRSARTQPRNN